MTMEYIYINQYDAFQAHLICEILTLKHIKFTLKDPYEESLSAGWMTPGSLPNTKELFVLESDVQKAITLIKTLNFNKNT